MALACAAVVLLLVSAWSSWRAASRLSAYRQAAAEARSAAAAEERSIDGRRGASRQDSASLASQVATLQLATPPTVLRDLEDLLPESVRFDGIALQYGERLRVVLGVVAQSPGDYDRFIDRLAASPRFESLILGSEDRSGEMVSTVTATYREAAAP